MVVWVSIEQNHSLLNKASQSSEQKLAPHYEWYANTSKLHHMAQKKLSLAHAIMLQVLHDEFSE